VGAREGGSEGHVDDDDDAKTRLTCSYVYLTTSFSGKPLCVET
jgi:hypothetical protein